MRSKLSQELTGCQRHSLLEWAELPLINGMVFMGAQATTDGHSGNHHVPPGVTNTILGDIKLRNDIGS